MTDTTLQDPCAKTGRRVVTVAQWHHRPDELVDVSAYWFSPELEQSGLDPWSLIDGVDAHTDDAAFDVWFASGRMKAVPGGQEIYIRARDYAPLSAELLRLGLSLPAGAQKLVDDATVGRMLVDELHQVVASSPSKV